jgi:hypothetical protein
VRKLSELQREALLLLLDGPVTEPWALMNLGRMRQVTMRVLVERGLARWHYTSEVWRITKDGRIEANNIIAEDLVREHREAQHKIVEQWQRGDGKQS